MNTQTGHKGAQHWLNKDRGIKTKLTGGQIEEIMIELRDGQSQNFIATEFNASRSTIQAINEGRYAKYRVPSYRYPVAKREPAVEYIEEDDEQNYPEEFPVHLPYTFED
jgi:DNA-binding NarL/FixJ family response regulator